MGLKLVSIRGISVNSPVRWAFVSLVNPVNPDELSHRVVHCPGRYHMKDVVVGKVFILVAGEIHQGPTRFNEQSDVSPRTHRGFTRTSVSDFPRIRAISS